MGLSSAMDTPTAVAVVSCVLPLDRTVSAVVSVVKLVILTGLVNRFDPVKFLCII